LSWRSALALGGAAAILGVINAVFLDGTSHLAADIVIAIIFLAALRVAATRDAARTEEGGRR
jgi:hypothetical protein